MTKVQQPVHLYAILEEVHRLDHQSKMFDILSTPLVGREGEHPLSPWRHVNLCACVCDGVRCVCVCVSICIQTELFRSILTYVWHHLYKSFTLFTLVIVTMQIWSHYMTCQTCLAPQPRFSSTWFTLNTEYNLRQRTDLYQAYLYGWRPFPFYTHKDY